MCGPSRVSRVGDPPRPRTLWEGSSCHSGTPSFLSSFMGTSMTHFLPSPSGSTKVLPCDPRPPLAGEVGPRDVRLGSERRVVLPRHGPDPHLQPLPRSEEGPTASRESPGGSTTRRRGDWGNTGGPRFSVVPPFSSSLREDPVLRLRGECPGDRGSFGGQSRRFLSTVRSYDRETGAVDPLHSSVKGALVLLRVYESPTTTEGP